MLPVQTVMIRYMVLVYRWGRGWLGAVGDWVGFVGGDVTGGGARRGELFATGPGREKAPPTRGRRGLLEVNAIRWVLPVWARAKARGRKARNPQE